MRLIGRMAAALLCVALSIPALSRGAASQQPTTQQPVARQATSGEAADTLGRLRRAGVMRCGIITSGLGLSMLDVSGRWQGFHVDICRAIAAAVLESADSVEFVETTAENRFAAVRDGIVDVVMQGTTWTLQREATLGVAFPVVHLFDGQGVMAHRSAGISSLAGLKGGTVCVIEGTTTLRNLQSWTARTGVSLTLKPLRSTEGALSAFFNRHCDLFTNDRISLYAQRLSAPNRDEYIVLPDVISKEPLAPMVRSGDRRWYDIVRWVVLAMVLAEEKGLTSANTATLKETGDPEVERLLGLEPGIGRMFGLDDRWAARVILQVGNYGEVFERNLGKGSPLGIERGLNALWSRGGLHFAPPLGW